MLRQPQQIRSITVLRNCYFGNNSTYADYSFNPTALRKAKIVYNFGISECIWVHLLSPKTPVASLLKLTVEALQPL